METAQSDARDTVTQPVEETAKPKEPAVYGWLAVLSIVMTLVAWGSAFISGIAAIALGAVSIIIGACSLKSRRGAVRNTAITAIIADAVLVLVVGAFIVSLHLLLTD